MNNSPTLGKIGAALAAAQTELENATKNASNPHFKSKYADLAEIINTVRPVLAKHGIAFIQSPGLTKVDGAYVVEVETTFLHSSGEWISGIVATPVSKPDAQGVGSAIMYMRRYSLAAFAGIAQEDDDGEKAVGRGPTAKKAEPKVAAKGDPTVEQLKAALADAKTKAELTTLATWWSTNAPDIWVSQVAAAKKMMAELP